MRGNSLYTAEFFHDDVDLVRLLSGTLVFFVSQLFDLLSTVPNNDGKSVLVPFVFHSSKLDAVNRSLQIRRRVRVRLVVVNRFSRGGLIITTVDLENRLNCLGHLA